MEDLKKGILVRNGVCVGAVGDKYFSTAPLGTVLSYAGQTAPHGYLLADGASYKVADYPHLYAVIGNTYGGDSTNFNVPNLVDKFIQGSTASGTEKEAGLPNIEGSISNAGATQNDQFLTDSTSSSIKTNGALSIAGYANKTSMANGTDSFNTPTGFKFDASKSNEIYGNSDTVQPPALTMVYIIKAFHTNEGVDSGVSDDVVEYVDNKFSSVDIKTTATIPAGQYLKVALGENKLSTVLLSMKTTIGTGYTTFLISNYGIGTNERCRVQQLQGERKFAKYIDGCNLYIAPSVTDQVWYASAIAVQGVNPVLSASETYTGTEITTNSVPKEIVDGLISDTSTGSTSSTWSSSKIASEINPTIDISKVFSNGALNIATLCSTYGNGRYVIVGQGTAGNGSATIDIWTLASNAISYIVNVTYSNKTSNTFIGLTYENPTVNFETNYLSACNHIAKVCTLA